MVAAQFFLFNAQQFAAEVLRLLECQAGTSAEVSLRQRLGRRWGIPPVDWLSASVGGIWTRAYPDADDTASVMDGEDDGNVTADEEDDLMGGGAAAEEAEVERDIEACHVAPLEIAGGKQLGPASTNGQTNGSMTGVTKAEAGGRGRSGGPTGLRQFCRPIFAARFMWQRMRLWLRIGTWRKQLLPAVRVSIACTVAGAIGTGFIEDFGFWAVVTVAFIIGGNQGGAFRAASLRLQGTVAGAIFGYLAVQVAKHNRVVAVALLVPWVVLTSYVRYSARSGYAGIVAAFTAAIIVIGYKGTQQEVDVYALRRITETFVGVLCFVTVEGLVFPVRATWLLRASLESWVQACSGCVESVVAASMTTSAGTAGERLAAAQQSRALLKSMADIIARQGGLAAEAEAEPSLCVEGRGKARQEGQDLPRLRHVFEKLQNCKHETLATSHTYADRSLVSSCVYIEEF
eukprot:jgi/Mesen1/1232/ME000129S00331